MIFACFAPNPAIAGALEWGPNVVTTGTALLAEAFATMVLALVVFAVVDERNTFAPSLPVFALILGLVVGFIIAVEAPLTMAGINPARDLGPRIAISLLGWAGVAFAGSGSIWWVWTVGPILWGYSRRRHLDVRAWPIPGVPSRRSPRRRDRGRGAGLADSRRRPHVRRDGRRRGRHPRRGQGNRPVAPLRKGTAGPGSTSNDGEGVREAARG
jgi:hypothetical protein